MLKFELQWKDPAPAGTAADATWGRLTVHLGSVLLWGTAGDEASPRPIEWTWVELLEALASDWSALHAETGWPAGLNVASLSDFPGVRDYTRARLTSARKRETFESEVFEFRQRHDLSAGLQGISLPALWIVREGKSAWVGSPDHAMRLPFGAVAEELERVGEKIATRLRVLDDATARATVALWDERASISPTELVELATGMLADEIHALTKKVQAFFDIDAQSLEPTELMAVARMSAGIISAESRAEVLKAMRRLPATRTPALDGLAARARPLLERWQGPPDHTQGYELAEWIRADLKWQSDAAIDPEELLAEWGVVIRDIDLPERLVDALACWGPHHGPVVLVNVRGTHARSANGRRTTLAHEIAHLLVDRADALPLSEVIGGNAPRAVEKRARAFAAELLLPRSVARETFARTEPTKALKELCEEFGVSREIAVWQVHNSGLPLSSADIDTIRNFLTSGRSRGAFLSALVGGG